MRLIIFFTAVSLFACEKPEKLATKEGFLHVDGGKVWYRVTGGGDGVPILLLHGGPGYPSHYLNPLTALSAGRPVIMFDQLGCGRSDRTGDTTLMSMDNHIHQVKQLVKELDLQEFFLYGHSWGTMLATDYYLNYPGGVKALILASPCLSAKMWVNDARRLIATLPDSVQIVLKKTIEGIPQDSALVKGAVDTFLENFFARKKPISADLDSASSQVGYDVYRYMWGENEFFATGVLKDYDRTGDLGKIAIPTLYTVGEFDEATPETVKYYQSLTPGSKLEIIYGAGHMTMHDNPEADLRAISEFLNGMK